MYQIYAITNKLNGKKYIGCTSKTIKERFDQHYRDRNKFTGKLHIAMRQHPKSDFEIETLEVVESPENKEAQYIRMYDSFYNGYNSSINGMGYKKIDNKVVSDLKKDLLQFKSLKKVAEKHDLNISTITKHIVKKDIVKSNRHYGENQYGVFCKELNKTFETIPIFIEELSKILNLQYKTVETSVYARKKGLIKKDTPYRNFTMVFIEPKQQKNADNVNFERLR